MVFDLICMFVSSTWWSVWLIFLIVFQRYWLKGFIFKLWQQLALWVTFCRSLVAVLLGGQDLGPPFIEHILFSFELLLFLFQAPRCGDELSLEAFLLEGFLWDDKVFVTEAHILFGNW